MERGMILLIAALVVYVAPDVQGSSHLSFADNTTMVNITRDGCGVSKLCVSTPDNCDPAVNGSCLFASVVSGTTMIPKGTPLSIELRGYSTGYVALGLTMNASEGYTMLFICAQNSSNNGTFFFRTRQRNNTDNMLTPTERNVTQIVGMVNGNMISCEFDIPNVNDTNTVILLGNGTYNSSGLGPFVLRLNAGSLDVTNPATNVPTTAAPNTTMTNTTMPNSGGAVQPHAVLSLLSILTLFVMLRA